MIEIDDSNKRTTIPSVVSFVSSNDDDQLPWYASLGIGPSDEVTWPRECAVYVGETAIEAENLSPRSTYRNVKRIIGTGGKMAELSAGLVPNLYISSSVDADGLEHGESKKKKQKKRKQSWKRKKWIKRQSELPNLQRQLEDAIDDPALLSCQLGDATGTILRPEQISCIILRHLYDCAEKHHRQYELERGGNSDYCAEQVVKVTRAVIGVPAYFTGT